MRELAALVVMSTLLCSGCPRDTPPDRAVSQATPAIACPPGTFPAGLAPPAGGEVWCEIRTSGAAARREGPAMSWHGNERRRWEGTYVAGQPNGTWLYWYATGSPEAQGSFSRGLKEGLWVTYHPSGDRASEGSYVDGKEHGPWVFWDAESATRTEGEFVLGARTGRWHDYGPDGAARRYRIYRDGRLVEQGEL
ncbi:MAG: hypothetical protein KTR31_39220 [Myxococcales bacterium]|nr:hypothetical protein [Myxococcales bacterium]